MGGLRVMMFRGVIKMNKPLRCEYPCSFHSKQVDWHHPISSNGLVGIYLCQAHHSLLMGRKKIYLEEQNIGKTLSTMRGEICLLVADKVIEAGLPLALIDKN
jgi:hypothetical protein